MKYKKLLKATTILILINICATLSLESDSLQSKTITTTGDVPPTTALTAENFHRKQRQSRCSRCYEERPNVEHDSKYGNRQFEDEGRYSRDRYYSPYPSSRRASYDDTNNWYNQNDRYDRPDDKARYYENSNRYPDRYSNRFIERDRYIPDRYPERYPVGGIRNDDRYHFKTYDQYDNRPPSYPNRYESRPELYNNRGYDQGQEYRSRFNERERPSYDRARPSYDRARPGGHYNERNYDYDPYDRYNFRDFDYDNRNYRPVDETYRDQEYHPGRGNGYANNDMPSRYPNNLPYSPPSRNQYLPNSQSPPRPLQSQNSSLNSNQDSTPDYHNNRPQPDKNSNNGYAGDWNYSNDRNKQGYNSDKDKETHSSPYGGGRSRPLTGSYLLDRKSNIPMELQNKNGLNNTDDKNVNMMEQRQNDSDKKKDEKSNKNK